METKSVNNQLIAAYQGFYNNLPEHDKKLSKRITSGNRDALITSMHRNNLAKLWPLPFQQAFLTVLLATFLPTAFFAGLPMVVKHTLASDNLYDDSIPGDGDGNNEDDEDDFGEDDESAEEDDEEDGEEDLFGEGDEGEDDHGVGEEEEDDDDLDTDYDEEEPDSEDDEIDEDEDEYEVDEEEDDEDEDDEDVE